MMGDQMTEKEQKRGRNFRGPEWIGICTALGAGIGVAIDSIPIGVGIGAVAGMAVFLAINLRNRGRK